MAHITVMILSDHDDFRRRFRALHELDDAEALQAAWQALADLLEVHAAAEEAVFYPALLKADRDAKPDTADAIRDHNKIRDAIKEAREHPAGSKAWWKSVRDAEKENDEHLGEEEDGPVPDFAKRATPPMQEDLARQFGDFKRAHAGAKDLDESDKDPKAYIEAND
ncbi:MAG: hypothetical protein NVS3B7_07610 [Candidatus Elarobacter sp.]